MVVRWYRKTGWLLLTALSFVLLGLALIPILFPVVLALGIPLAGAMVFLLWRARRRGELQPQSMDPTGPVQRPESRILRRSLFAMGMAVVLYALLWLHSHFFYIIPLKQEQEPFRQDAIEQFQEKE